MCSVSRGYGHRPCVAHGPCAQMLPHQSPVTTHHSPSGVEVVEPRALCHSFIRLHSFTQLFNSCCLELLSSDLSLHKTSNSHHSSPRLPSPRAAILHCLRHLVQLPLGIVRFVISLKHPHLHHHHRFRHHPHYHHHHYHRYRYRHRHRHRHHRCHQALDKHGFLFAAK